MPPAGEGSGGLSQPTRGKAPCCPELGTQPELPHRRGAVPNYHLSVRTSVPPSRAAGCPFPPRAPFFTRWPRRTPGPMAKGHPGPSNPSSGQQGTQWGAGACTLPGCRGKASPPFGAPGGKPTAAAHAGGRASPAPLAICAAHPEIPAWGL